MSAADSDHNLPTPSESDTPRPLPSTVTVAKPVAGVRYQILRPHDKGGIGEVFVALDQELNRQVALKEIQERHAADAHTCGRFVREAEITGGLEHPGIVPVYGLGQYADGRPFYAMRFIQGETLKDAIARYHRTSADGCGARSPEFELRALLTRFVAVCNTIAYAHSRGVIHRDIKPSNIMLGKYGETLIVDWGMAKSGMNKPSQNASKGLPEPTLVPSLADAIETQAGAAMGTPAYMSPEQATGLLELIGPASDIYSLGATLYTLLTGRPPIEGKDTAEILRKSQRSEWLPPRQVRPDVPPALDAVCRKAMAPLPSARYVTALELSADVERWLADEPVAVYRESWTARSRRWMRRHRTLVSTAVGVLVIALLGTTIGLVLISDAWDKEATARQAADNEKEEARKQTQEAIRRREEARFNQYVAQMNLVQREYEANRIARVRDILEAQVPRESDTTDFRNFEWYYWHRMAHRELLTLKGHISWVYGVCFSPDGRRLASAGDGTVRVRDASTGQELLTLKGHTDHVRGVCFSSDGRRLASASNDSTVRVWDASTGQELLTLKGHTQSALGVSFSPDGRRLASAGWDGTVRVWNAVNGQELLTLKGHTSVASGVSFSPDGRRLASSSWDSTLRLWDSSTGQELINLRGHMNYVLGVSFSPDGQRLASVDGDGTVRVWYASTDQDVLTLKGHTNQVHGVSFSPDGRRLASAGWDNTVRVWDSSTGQELLTLKGHTGAVQGVSFSPSGRRLASAGDDRTVRVWDGSTGEELLTLKGHTDRIHGVSFGPDAPVHGVSFSPDGRRLASAGWDNTVRVWDASIGQELLTLKGHTDRIHSVSFSPDGRRLASAGSDRMVRVWDSASGRELLALKGHTGAVDGVSFSPDGRRLASAGDGTVRVWDASTGQELLTLKGHIRSAYGVSFSSDGCRLASADGGGTVRVWDAASGQELLTLKGHIYPVHGVSFSPDGRRLASASFDRTVRVWEASPVPDEVCRRRWLVSWVTSLFGERGFREEVLTALRKDSTLSGSEREFALQLAQNRSEDPVALNEAAWMVVKDCTASKDAYVRALRQAEVAVKLAPKNGNILHTLGIAQYRIGRYADALAILTKGSLPSDFAFVAMTQHQLGKKDEAKAMLGRLREIMKQPRWSGDAESVGFLREAEELIEGKSAGKE